MHSDYADSLLRKGIIEAKAGEKKTARRYLERTIDTGGNHAVLSEAWFWMSQIEDDTEKKRSALKNCISYDMRHARARRNLAVLEGKLDQNEIINPDALPTPSTDPKQSNADRFMCPQCGAKMVFSPDGSSLFCENCAGDQKLRSRDEAEEQDFLIAMATSRGHGKPVATQVFHCQGCGAEFILAPNVISTDCTYCESPHVVNFENSREMLQPEGIIPHAFNQKQITQFLVEWVELNGIKPQEKVNIPRGIYLPIWTFDIGGAIVYRGDRYKSDNRIGPQSHGVVRVEDEYQVQMDDLTLPASRKIASYVERLLPSLDLKEVKPYDPRYLASWIAEVYDIPLAEASLEARSRAYRKLKRELPGDIVSLYNLQTSSANLAIESFKLVLFPAWITKIPTDNKNLLLIINGQNGIVQADSPSKQKTGLVDWLENLQGN